MKKLRQFFIVLLCIILVFIAIGFLLPQKIQVVRSVNIKSNQIFIYKTLNAIKKWELWSMPLLPSQILQIKHSGPETGAGAKLIWKSNSAEVTTGSISITHLFPYDSLYILLDYVDKGKSSIKIILNKEAKSTRVWLKYGTNLGINPISRWIGLFSDRMIGSDLQQSLNSMKREIEKPKTYFGLAVEELEIPSQLIVSIRDTAALSTISKKLVRMNRRISQFVKNSNLSPSGEPFTVYHSYSTSGFDIETCLPVAAVYSGTNDVIYSEIPARKAVKVKFTGTNKDITLAYQALNNYINDNGLQIIGPPWEQYIRTSANDSLTRNLQTNVYYPVR